MFQQRLGDPRNPMKRWELELTFVCSTHGGVGVMPGMSDLTGSGMSVQLCELCVRCVGRGLLVLCTRSKVVDESWLVRARPRAQV